MISRMSSMPVCEAASISITSMCRPSAMARHGSQTLHGVIVGPPVPSGPTQFSALAIRRAVEVLPTPLTPGEQEGMRDPAPLDRIGERRHHRILADQLGEGLRPVFAGEHPIGRCARRCGDWGRSRPNEGRLRNRSRSGESDIAALFRCRGRACRSLIPRLIPTSRPPLELGPRSKSENSTMPIRIAKRATSTRLERVNNSATIGMK